MNVTDPRQLKVGIIGYGVGFLHLQGFAEIPRAIEESGVNFAGNRVRSLTLTKLRWTDSNDQVYELNAPIDVGADLDP